jgi:uncharacterized membrane protein HdeD (DUF308 family)
VHGIFEIIGAIQLRKEIDNEWMLILGGLLSVVFGLIVLFGPRRTRREMSSTPRCCA